MSLKFYSFFFIILYFCPTKTDVYTIMLDPAGDTKHTGRIIEDSFERGITLQFAQKLKKLLELYDSELRVILTRFPGETLEPLQNAHFANRLDVDCYISFHFYYERETKPSVFLYYFMNNPTDNWKKPHQQSHLSFEPYDKAHIAHTATTKEYAEFFKTKLMQPSYNTLFDVKGLWGIPFKPLVGIVCPITLGFEASLKTKDQWAIYLDPIAHSIIALVKKLRT